MKANYGGCFSERWSHRRQIPYWRWSHWPQMILVKQVNVLLLISVPCVLSGMAIWGVRDIGQQHGSVVWKPGFSELIFCIDQYTGSAEMVEVLFFSCRTLEIFVNTNCKLRRFSYAVSLPRRLSEWAEQTRCKTIDGIAERCVDSTDITELVWSDLQWCRACWRLSLIHVSQQD